MKTPRTSLALVLVWAMAQAAPAAAQPVSVRFSPRVGVVSPDAYLFEYFANFAGDGQMEWSTGALRRALAVGLSVETDLLAGAVTVRGELMGSFEGWTSVSHSIVVPRDLYEPSYVETTWIDVPSSVAMASLQALLPTRLVLGRFRPYVLVGVAGKYYDFGEPTPRNTVNATLPTNGMTWGADVGGGVQATFLGLTWDVQGRDAVSRYWGKNQHDLVFSGGVIIPVG